MDDTEEDSFYGFFKFKATDLISEENMKMINEQLASTSTLTQNELKSENQESLLRSSKLTSTHFISFKIKEVILVEIELFVQKIAFRTKSFFIGSNYSAKIIDKEKVTKNAALFFDVKAHCNNLEDMLGSVKNRIFLNHDDSIIESFSHIFSTKITPSEKDEIILELRLDLENVFHYDSKLAAGFVNLGVTCYMNSYLQANFHIKRFREYIVQMDNDNNETGFVFALQSLFYMMEKVKEYPLNP